MIKGKKISCSYKSKKGTTQVLKDVSFELKKGRITTFMGQSGAGKTTLLKCIANLNSGYEGIIMAEDRNVKSLNSLERATTVGFVFQQFHLFPHLTVLKNCTYALVSAMGINEAGAELKAAEVLDILGMRSYVQSYPSQLSGGQQQRVAIARALVLHPEILLLDEPTSSLDPESKKSLETLLLELNAGGITIALSSHDMPFIRKIMDVVYFMEQGELVEEWDKKDDQLSSKEKIHNFLHHN